MFQRASSHSSHPLRVVIETDDPSLAVADFVSFATAGFDVACCSGPDGEEACPATQGRACSLVADADVVFNHLTDPQCQMDVVQAVRRTAPDVPMVVGGCAGVAYDRSEGCALLSDTTSVNGQINAVRRAAVHARAGTQ